MGWWRGLLRSVWGSLSKEVREHVGTDHLGNKYYFIPEYKNWRGVCEPIDPVQVDFRNISKDIFKKWSVLFGQTIREKRIIEAANRKELDYEAGDIPTEWEAWIRRTRKTPPTMEEILKNEKYREEIKIKSKDFYEKDRLGKEASEELLPPPAATQIKGHAAAPYFGKEEPSGAPTSTGQTFQPGSWMPEDDKRQNP